MKKCSECGVDKNLEEFSKDKYCKSGLSYSCKECNKNRHKIYSKNNSDKNKIRKIVYIKNNPNKNKEYRIINKNKIDESNKLYRKNNADKIKLCKKKYKKSNPDKLAYHKAKRRAKKLKATPLWLTDKHWKEIEEFYVLAKELAWLNQDCNAFHVDHIVPLQGKEVCGLHVPWNLQLLTAQNNLLKGNNL